MSTKGVLAPESKGIVPPTTNSASASELLQQYGCGPIPFVGSESAFYERHIVFDRVIDPKGATARERFEAISRSVRDILTQRWVLTKNTYERENAKRIYYLSMEFLIGRSLANNVTNLLLDPVVQQHAVQEKGIDWLELIEQEPDAGLGNGGLGRPAACFLDSMATKRSPSPTVVESSGYSTRLSVSASRVWPTAPTIFRDWALATLFRTRSPPPATKLVEPAR